MVQIQPTRGGTLVIYSRQHRQEFVDFIRVCCVAASHGAELALPNQSVAKVRIERQIVGSKESREQDLLLGCELPDIACCNQSGMSLILLSRINRISQM